MKNFINLSMMKLDTKFTQVARKFFETVFYLKT